MLVAQVSVNLIREFPGVREGEIAPLCHEVDDTICLPGYLVGELGGERIQIIEGSGLHFRDEMIHRKGRIRPGQNKGQVARRRKEDA